MKRSSLPTPRDKLKRAYDGSDDDESEKHAVQKVGSQEDDDLQPVIVLEEANESQSDQSDICNE